MDKKKQKNEIAPLNTTVPTANPEGAKLPVKIDATLLQYFNWSHFIENLYCFSLINIIYYSQRYAEDRFGRKPWGTLTSSIGAPPSLFLSVGIKNH